MPVAAMPFGMVQLGPDTRTCASGYHYDDENLLGFSHLTFEENVKTLDVKTGISAVDVAGAHKNLITEVAKKSFDEVKTESHDNNISLVDFYLKTANNVEYYSNDGVHFNSEGVNVEAELVTQKILEILNKQ